MFLRNRHGSDVALLAFTTWMLIDRIDASTKLAPRSHTWFQIGDVKPRGWLQEQAQIQASTLGGHLQIFWLPDNKWLGGSKCPSVLCESVPYWLNGMIPLAVQLDNDELLNVVHTYVKGVLDLQQSDGWMGPGNISSMDPSASPWPRYRMLTALGQYADIPNADPRTVDAMRRLVGALRTKLSNYSVGDLKYKFPWAHARWQELVYNAQWLVDRDPKHENNSILFDAMHVAMSKGLSWSGWYKSRICANASDNKCFPCREFSTPKQCEFASGAYFCQHGVNVPQSLTAFGVSYRLFNNLSEGAAAKQAVEKLDHCHGQPGGVWSAHEALGGIQPNCGTETCSVVETMDTVAELFSYFGDPILLDRIEEAAFNRLPASYFNGSMWSLTYFHQTNDKGGCNQYGLPFECCVANGNQGWPKFISHLYAKRGDNEIAALMYAPSFLNTTLTSNGLDNQVQILLNTSYPFSGELHFVVNAAMAFKLWLRIPGWAFGTTVAIGGVAAVAPPGSFYAVDVLGGRQIIITLAFPMNVNVQREAAGGVSVHAGPLLFALDMAPVETKSASCYYPPEGCGAKVDPTINWRTALVLDSSNKKTGGMKVDWPIGSDVSHSTGPFQRSSPLPTIRVAGSLLTAAGWPTVNCTSMESGCHDCVGPVPNVTVAKSRHNVTLIPFGATDVRIAVLPALWTDGEIERVLVV